MERESTTKSSGFTLVELMIVVVVISIVAAIAIPNYFRYTITTARKDAVTEVLQLAQKLEKVRGKIYSYPVGNEADFTAVTNRYEIATEIEDATFSIVATPIGSQQQDFCGEMTYNSDGSWSFSDDATEGECI